MPAFFKASIMVSPILSGVSATGMPQAFKAAVLPAAVPAPPEMMAPACPMRFPGGAVLPEIKAATGFFIYFVDTLAVA